MKTKKRLRITGDAPLPMNRAIGNVLTRWELLDNDILSDPEMKEMREAMSDLYKACENNLPPSEQDFEAVVKTAKESLRLNRKVARRTVRNRSAIY